MFVLKVNLGLYGLYWARRAALWRALSILRSICSANLDRPLCCRLAVWQGRRGHPLRGALATLGALWDDQPAMICNLATFPC